MAVSAHPLYQKFASSTALWGYYFFPHHFRAASPQFHLDILDAASRYRYLAVAAPRESAKSTMLTFLDPFHDIFFQRRRFIVIVQNTFSKAASSLETMKHELKTNEPLNQMFPGVVLCKDTFGNAEFRHPNGYTTKVLCKGADQIGSIRGEKFGAYRPDKLIGDDIEDDEMVLNPARRAALIAEHDEALTPAGDRAICQHVRIGTILHDDGLIARLVSKDHYREYHKLFYQALLDADTPTARSLWPEKWSLDDLYALRKTKPTVFAKEYQNDPASAQNVRFQRHDFRYWRLENDRYVLLHPDGSIASIGNLRDCKAGIACDLAWKEKRDADFTAVLPGLLTPTSDILLLPYWVAHGVRPDAFAEYLFTLDTKLRTMTGAHPPIGFEKAMLETVTQWILKKAMRARNHPLSTKQLEWDSDKLQRIETRIQPYLSQHMLYFQQGMGDLETQLERFPYGAKDDLVDALQGLVQLLRYPKGLKASPTHDDAFERMRKLTIAARQPIHRGLFTINPPSRSPQGIPSQQGL